MTIAETRDELRIAKRSNGQAVRSDRRQSSDAAAVSDDVDQRVKTVVAIAGAHAASVDRDGRFPAEAFAAAKAQRLMGIYAPAEFGGEGARIADVVDACFHLGRACASTGMIYAMHQIMVACLVRNAGDSGWHRRMLRRLCEEQWLIASSTTDGQGGGDLRKSDSSVVANGAQFSLEKSATVMSYGAQADALLTTARRAPDAAPTDQVLVALTKADYSLAHLVDWDTMGMRGTCSAGFKLEATGAIEQILSEPYQAIHTRTVVPFAHLTWSAVWTGIAAGAVDRARAFVRSASRKSGGQLPPGAAHLTRATAKLATLRAEVSSALQRFEAIALDFPAVERLEFQTSMNLLKVNASELSIATIMSALQACGLSGYRNDTDFSVTRHLRDALSSPIMINNDRILANASGAALLVDIAPSLRD